MKKLFLLLTLMGVISSACSSGEEDSILAERIELEKLELTMEIGEEVFVKCTSYPVNAIDGELIWSTTDNDLITIDGRGTIRAKRHGTAWIRIVNVGNTLTANIKVIINPIAAEKISLNREKVEIEAGSAFQLSATIIPPGSPDTAIEWLSSNTEVATVSANGLINALKIGECTITAVLRSNRSISASCKVNVLPAPPAPIEEIRFENYSNNVEEGKEIILKVKILPENYIEEKLVWSSEEPSIATVDQTGKVKGISVGLATIKVRTESGRVTGECRVFVNVNTSIVNIVFGSGAISSINGYVTGDVSFRVYNGTDDTITPTRVYITESLQNKVILEVSSSDLHPLSAKEGSYTWSAHFNMVYKPVFHCDYVSGGKTYTVSKEK